MVYRADRSTVGVYELFSVPTDFSAPSVRLNGPLPAGGSVAGLGFAGFSDFAIGAGDRVAYRADQTVPGTFELFSVPADGSASPLRLSPALVRVSSLWLSPAEDEVYFTTERSLYRVPLDGSTASRPVAADIPLEPMAFSPDGSTILGTHSPVEERAGLYTVPADGSATPVLLLEGGTSGFGYYSRFEDPRFASDGVHVLLNLENYYEVLYYDLFSVRWKSLGDRARAPGAEPRRGRLLDEPLRLNLTRFDYSGNFALDVDSPIDRMAFQEAYVVYSAAYDGAQRVALTPAGWTSEYDRIAVSGSDVVFGARTAAGRSVLR